MHANRNISLVKKADLQFSLKWPLVGLRGTEKKKTGKKYNEWI